MRELTAAHNMDQTRIESIIFSMEDFVNMEFDCPVKIIHVLTGGKSYTQSKLYQKIIKSPEINPTFILPEKKPLLGKIFIKFLSSNETVL